jgi:hypothetical protein
MASEFDILPEHLAVECAESVLRDS